MKYYLNKDEKHTTKYYCVCKLTYKIVYLVPILAY